MSSINDACRFIYANESSDLYGVGLCSAFGSTSRGKNSENRNIITSNNLLNRAFNFHGVKYESPLSFDIIIYNLDGTFINENQERRLKKWLLKESRNWFKVDQDTLSDVNYFCIATNSELLDVGTYSGGMLVTFVCDTYFAYSDLRKRTITTVDNTLSLKLNFDFDFDKFYILPTLTFKANGNGAISLKNVTTNETVSFSDCVTNEVIRLECDGDKFESSVRPSLISAWNKQGLSLIDGTNSLLLTGNFSLTIEYRLPVRVGA